MSKIQVMEKREAVTVDAYLRLGATSQPQKQDVEVGTTALFNIAVLLTIALF